MTVHTMNNCYGYNRLNDTEGLHEGMDDQIYLFALIMFNLDC